VVKQVLFRAVRADIALERELARDNFLDRDLLVPAVAALSFFAPRLGHFFRAAQRTPRLFNDFAGHLAKF
jgi:hypothetical protein